jgi:hypothetical protein
LGLDSNEDNGDDDELIEALIKAHTDLKEAEAIIADPDFRAKRVVEIEKRATRRQGCIKVTS